MQEVIARGGKILFFTDNKKDLLNENIRFGIRFTFRRFTFTFFVNCSTSTFSLSCSFIKKLRHR